MVRHIYTNLRFRLSDHLSAPLSIKGGQKNQFDLETHACKISGGFRVVPGVPWNPSFGLDLSLRSTDDRLNGTPLSG